MLGGHPSFDMDPMSRSYPPVHLLYPEVFPGTLKGQQSQAGTDQSPDEYGVGTGGKRTEEGEGGEGQAVFSFHSRILWGL